MAHLSFWAGLAVGWLTAIAAGCALWYGMLRYLRGMDPADLQPGGTRTVIHVGEPDPPDPLPLQVRCPICGAINCTHDPEFPPARDGEMPGVWPPNTRGPTTHYPPHSTHHDLTPDTDGDGTTIYRRTR